MKYAMSPTRPLLHKQAECGRITNINGGREPGGTALMKSLVAMMSAVLATNLQHGVMESEGVGDWLCLLFARTCCREQWGFRKASRPAVVCLQCPSELWQGENIQGVGWGLEIPALAQQIKLNITCIKFIHDSFPATSSNSS